jgi:hypothetical protein
MLCSRGNQGQTCWKMKPLVAGSRVAVTPGSEWRAVVGNASMIRDHQVCDKLTSSVHWDSQLLYQPARSSFSAMTATVRLLRLG